MVPAMAQSTGTVVSGGTQSQQFLEYVPILSYVPPQDQGNNLDLSSCVSYAKYRRPDQTFVWIAPKYVEAYPLRPSPGLLVLTTEGKYGHVAYVEQVSSSSMVISEANFLGDFISSRSLPLDASVIRGYR